MLVSLVVNSIQREIQQGDNVACVYFYFQDGEKHQVSQARVWATLLVQLLRIESGALADQLRAKFNDPLQGSSPLDSCEYLELFKAQAATFKTVYLVVDGLDSCTDTPGQEMQKDMRAALKTLPHGIRALFTCRDDWVGRELEAHQKLCIMPTEQDVVAYVKWRIEDDGNLRDLLAWKQNQESVMNKVTSMTVSSKMFLLARLHMDNLSKQGTLKDINTALSRLPDSASQVFAASAQQLADRIQAKEHEFESRLARHIFTWVMHAKTELNTEQIRDSYAVRHSESQAYQDYRPGKPLPVRVCAGLVTVDAEKETLSLVHKSAQTELRKHPIILEDAQVEIGKTCLSFLLIDDWDKEGEQEPPLLQYAARYWWAHLSHCESPEVERLMDTFLRDGGKLARAFKAMDGTNSSAFEGMTGLHATVHFNMTGWAERLLQSDMDANAQCADGQTALHWAVRYGRQEIVELLLQHSADANIQDGSRDAPLHKVLTGPTAVDTPLHQAVIRPRADDTGLVKALVRGNARLDLCGNKGLSPLSRAIRYGPTSVALTMIESQDNVDADISDADISKGWTALREIFFHGEDILDEANGEERAKLQKAVGNHARLLTNLLLKRGVDLNRPAQDGWMPLIYAARNGDVSKLKQLLRREPHPADANLQDCEGRTALYWAVLYKSIAAAELLIRYGADVNKRYEDGLTPLLVAVHGGDGDMAWMLLNAKARPDEPDGGRPALVRAINKGHRALAWLLVTRGASATSPSHGGKHKDSPLGQALWREDVSMAWLLHEKGASVNAVNDVGTPLLHWAVRGGRLTAARFLMDHGAALDARNAAQETALHVAVKSEHCGDELVALLCARFHQGLDAVDAEGNTALASATMCNRPSAVRHLLRHGARCMANAKGVSALHLAARFGLSDCLSLLVEHGADANAADVERFTPLHHAVSGEGPREDVVEALLGAGADLELRDKDGRTPLMLAVQLGQPRMLHLLLQYDADVRVMDVEGNTAADYAASEHPYLLPLLEEPRRPVGHGDMDGSRRSTWL
ncbi:hypothetical protein CDD82_6806 [Ophiocordyceps australis]|uniref:Nephrocystin 3-like N-terminal domain-containing protein n=1 Tax=Ophiocordyceps australis TaxID=1399860 RepID=A0A2C5XFY3_9HYPO|nr:hypothetical protein CDD82_6806 [Ophiocordyceps australis]